MEETYFCTKEKFLKDSKIPVKILQDETEMYEEMADIMINTVINNKSEKTVIICPVGPIGQYPIFAKKVNEQKISLKNCWFINMDEYLDENDKVIPYDSVLNFHAIMDKYLYNQIDENLNIPKEQRLFPEPNDINGVDNLIEKLGKVDCCLTGVGINGHIAFNEPPSKEDKISDEEFKNCNTRCLNISRETIVNNAANKILGALDIFPKRCITLGMKQLLKAKVLKIYLYCNWQWGIMRKIALEEPTRFAPASFLQEHSNAEMVISKELFNKKL